MTKLRCLNLGQDVLTNVVVDPDPYYLSMIYYLIELGEKFNIFIIFDGLIPYPFDSIFFLIATKMSR